MWLTLFLLVLTVGDAVDAVLSRIAVWGPPLAGIATGAVACRVTYSDTVRTRVRTTVRALSALRLPGAPLKPLTCTDTCPDMSADMRPDMSGRRSDGGR